MRYLTASEGLVVSRTQARCSGTSEALGGIRAQLAVPKDRRAGVVNP
jgi:hypothetical protein